MSALISSTIATEAPDFELFFDFPLEIQHKILTNLVTSDEDILFTNEGILRTPWCFRVRTFHNSTNREGSQVLKDPYRPSFWPLNYFLVSKQMYREARAVLLRQNTFKMNCYSFHYQFHKASVIQGATILPPKWPVLKQMRRVILEVNCNNDLLALDHLRRATLQFKDMMSFGNLRHLEIRIDRVVQGEDSGLVAAPYLLWDGGKDSSRAIAAFGPSSLKAHNGSKMFWEAGPQLLFELLSHPGLRSPRLAVVDRHHPQEWCEYHEECDGPPQKADRNGMLSVACTAAPMVRCRSMGWSDFLYTDVRALEKSVVVPAPPPIPGSGWGGVAL